MESLPLEMEDLFDNEADSGDDVGAAPMPEAREEDDHEAMSGDDGDGHENDGSLVQRYVDSSIMPHKLLPYRRHCVSAHR